MGNNLEINSTTKLADMLSAYPWLKKELPNVNERFAILQTPLAKVMLKTTTIADMSKRSGMDETILIERLKILITTHI